MDAESAPLAEKFSLDDVILGLASDLRALRAGSISVPDAKVRADLAKQIFNGVRLVIAARKVMEKGARDVSGLIEDGS